LDIPVLEKDTISLRFDLRNLFHGLDGRLHKFSVVTDRNVSSLLEVDCRVLQNREQSALKVTN